MLRYSYMRSNTLEAPVQQWKGSVNCRHLLLHVTHTIAYLDVSVLEETYMIVGQV